MKKKYTTLLQIIFIISIIITFTNVNGQSQNEDNDDKLHIGPGVIAIIVGFFVGLLICVFGLATTAPEAFIIIGFVIPVIIFLFCFFCPTEDKQDEKETDNKTRNVQIVSRWLYFSVMLACTIALFVPLFMLWNVMVVPQRVDSRSQKESDEEYKRMLERKRKEMEMKKREAEAEKVVDDPNAVVNTYKNPALNIPGNKNEEQKRTLIRRKRKLPQNQGEQQQLEQQQEE